MIENTPPTRDVAARLGPADGVFILKVDEPSTEPAIDVAAIWRFLIRFSVLISAVALIGAVTGYVLAKFSTRVYRAQVLLSMVSDRDDNPMGSLQARFGGLAGLAGIQLGSGNSNSAEYIAYLDSRTLIESYIREHKLLPILFAGRADAQGNWTVAKEKIPTLQDAYYFFKKSVMSVEQDRKTNLVTLQVEWRDPELAAKWANELVALADNALRQKAINQADAAMGFLNKELLSTTVVELRQALYSVIESQTQKRMLVNTRPDYAFRVLDPAEVSDKHRYVSPKTIAYVFVGGFVGMILGIAFAAIMVRRRASSGLHRS